MLANYLSASRDQFRFNQVFTDSGLALRPIQGAVRFTAPTLLRVAKHLSDLLGRAVVCTSISLSLWQRFPAQIRGGR